MNMASCDLHLVPDCPICKKLKPAATPSPAQPNLATNVPAQISAPTPPPVTVSDPHASKVLAAANAYAASCDNFKTISDEVKSLEQKMLDAKKRLAAAATTRDAAHAEMVKLMGEKA